MSLVLFSKNSCSIALIEYKQDIKEYILEFFVILLSYSFIIISHNSSDEGLFVGSFSNINFIILINSSE